MSAPGPKDANWPAELVFRRAERRLEISFCDGFEGVIAYKRLREESPSAEVRGHGGPRPAQAPVPEDIGVVSAETVGRYAVRITFSDGHSTGIYAWSYLRQLAQG